MGTKRVVYETEMKAMRVNEMLLAIGAPINLNRGFRFVLWAAIVPNSPKADRRWTPDE